MDIDGRAIPTELPIGRVASPRARSGSAGQSSANLSNICRQAIDKCAGIEAGSAPTLSDRVGEQLSHELRKCDPALGGHGF
jgi:hypothetical protein